MSYASYLTDVLRELSKKCVMIATATSLLVLGMV